MFVLHVDISLKPNVTTGFETAYRETFVPAIARQPGFVETRLLKSRAPETYSHRLLIGFESESKQQQWVATDLHQEVWPKLEGCISQYTIQKYETVDGEAR